VNDHRKYVFSMYSLSRVGEFIELSARKGSGRGLLYKVSLLFLTETVDNSNPDENQHIHFIVFRNEREEAETAICLIRDAKGITITPKGSVPCLEEQCYYVVV
jgi:hypothetical protein